MNKVRIKQLEDIGASNVYLDRDLKVTTKVGEIKTFDPGKNYATVSATKPDGTKKTVQEVIEEIFSKDRQPSVVPPSLQVYMKAHIPGIGLELNPVENAVLVEAGSRVLLSASSLFDAGSYTYGPATGCTAGAVGYRLAVRVAGEETFDGTVNPNGGERDYILPATPEASVYLKGACEHSAASSTAVTALDSPTDISIASGRVEGVSGRLITALPIFAGTHAGDPADGIKYLRRLPSMLMDPSKGMNHMTIEVEPGAERIIVAAPVSAGPLHAVLASSMNADITANFISNQTAVVKTESGAGALGTYNVWVFEPSAFQGNEVIKIVFNM